jgi:hypothetical protein
LEALAIGGTGELLGRAGETLGVARGGADRRVDHRHDLLDLVDHLGADIVDAIGETARRDEGLVDLVEVGRRQGAVAAEHLVDALVQRRLVAGRVGVPDLIVARMRGLPQRFDLSDCDFRERESAFVLVGRGRNHDPHQA